MDTVNIIDSIEQSLLNYNGLRSVSDRYYEHKFCNQLDKIGTNLRHRISFHTNKICMLSLADDHPVISQKLNVKKVNFKIDGSTDRLKNVASGKGKRGAQKLDPESIICYVETDNGSYPVYSCVKGKLIEINENIIDNPNLLVEKPVSNGYIALMLPVLNHYATLKSGMLSKDEYTAINGC